MPRNTTEQEYGKLEDAVGAVCQACLLTLLAVGRRTAEGVKRRLRSRTFKAWHDETSRMLAASGRMWKSCSSMSWECTTGDLCELEEGMLHINKKIMPRNLEAGASLRADPHANILGMTSWSRFTLVEHIG